MGCWNPEHSFKRENTQNNTNASAEMGLEELCAPFSPVVARLKPDHMHAAENVYSTL
jgi:hypothetical protein